jgi:hypothetical protein
MHAQSILAAYRREREAKRQDALQLLNEAKLVVVGNEAVGKTSLIRYLLYGKPRNPDEKKTAQALSETQRAWLEPKAGVSAADQARRHINALAHGFYTQ